MNVIINYAPDEKHLLVSLAGMFKSFNIKAGGTLHTHDITSLVSLAKTAKADAIIVANQETLVNITGNKKATLDAYRGSRFNSSIPVFVINKLSHLFTVPHGRFLLEIDLARVTQYKMFPHKFNYTTLLDTSKFNKYYNEISKAVLLTYDVETKTEEEDGLEVGETLITCASWTALFPDGGIKTYVLPLIDYDGDHWKTNDEYASALLFLRKVNALPIPKGMHNGTYDCTHSIRYHAEPVYYNLDTMAITHSEYSELPKTLDFVASLHLHDYQQWKHEAEEASKNKDIRAYWTYNAKDTWYTMRILLSQLKRMPEYAKRNYAEQFKLVYPALYCAFEGFKIDQAEQNKLRDEAQAKLEKHRTLLQTYTSDPNFNPGSWQQVEFYIYKIFGAIKPKIGKSKSGTDEKNLASVADQHPLLARLVDSILEYRDSVKAIGTYYNFLQCKGRLLWALNFFGTESGRASCNSSNLWCGTQVQNIPKYGKAFLIADDGFEIVEVDNKQSEGRCTAYLAEDEALIKALEDPVYDFYKTLGTLFFSIPYEEVTEFFRNKVLKRIVHGTNYMMGGKTFKENVGVKILEEAASILGYKLTGNPSKRSGSVEMTHVGFSKLLLEKYHVPFPKVRLWYKAIEQEVARTSKLVSPLGHVRHFFGDIVKNHNVLRTAVSHQPQNLSVAILNKGLWRVYVELVVAPQAPLKLGDYRLKAQIHDSILAQYVSEKRDYIIPKMMELMTNPVEVKGRTLLIPVDAKYGTRWNKCKDYVRETND